MHFTDNDELVDEEGMYYDIQDEYKQWGEENGYEH
jgi:hypothetical protein